MFISVIIASGRPNIGECIDSLLDQTFRDYEILLVSENDMVVRNDKRIRVVGVKDGNVSFKRNRGAELAKGDVFCFVDDDVVVPADYLSKAAVVFERYPGISGFGGANLLPINAPFLEMIADQVLNFKYFGSGLETYSDHQADRPARTGELHSCNLFIKRNAFMKVSGFNEKINFGGEDTELIYLAQRRQNLEFRFISDVYVYHHRRRYGPAYFHQRFLTKSNLGKMLWVYPEMYFSNHAFFVFIAAAVIFLLSLPFIPILLPISAAFYLVTVVSFSLKYLFFDWRLFMIMPAAVVLHNLTYLGAITYGLLSASWQLNNLRQIRR
jgi:glycosyltransferase involved in cell wall biosynthesis